MEQLTVTPHQIEFDMGVDTAVSDISCLRMCLPHGIAQEIYCYQLHQPYLPRPA